MQRRTITKTMGICLIVGFVSWAIFSSDHQNTLQLEQTDRNRIRAKLRLSKEKSSSYANNPHGISVESSTTSSQNNASDLEKWEKKIYSWIDEFPFDQKKTHFILGANSPEVVKAITDFQAKIEHNLVNNPSLSRENKARVLWDVYKNYDWPGDTDALKESVGDQINGLLPYQLSEEIYQHYQELMQRGQQSIQTRHNLIELTDRIMDYGKEQIANDRQQEAVYSNSIPYLKEMLRQQIARPADVPFFDASDEIGDLMGLSMRVYAEHASQSELESLMPELQAAINDRPEQLSDQMYFAVFDSLFNNPDKSLSSVNALLSSTNADIQDGMNKTLSFLLKEDGNVNLSALPQEMRSSLSDYFQSQNNIIQGNDYEMDWNIAFKRLH